MITEKSFSTLSLRRFERRRDSDLSGEKQQSIAETNRFSPVLAAKGEIMAAALGKGVYGFSEAAKLVGLKQSRVREWFKNTSGKSALGSVFSSDYTPLHGEYAISFHDLIEVYVAGQLRDHGVSLQNLRRVYKRMRKALATDHPFCKKVLLTDGKIVFMSNVDEDGEKELTEVLSGQGVFPEIIEPFLQAIDYEPITDLAQRWHIGDLVVVDPAISFGKPIVEDVGIKTAILTAAYNANGHNADVVADWFDVQPRHVHAAVKFEASKAA